MSRTVEQELAECRAEVARLRGVVAEHERFAARLAWDTAGLVQEYVEVHGHSLDAAVASAWSEASEAARSIDEVSRYQSEQTTEDTTDAAQDGGDV